MKTYKHLFEKITSFENLLRAAKQAQKGKKMKHNVSEFNFGLESEILKLQDELKNQAYRPGRYRHFYVNDPKRRLISAAPYRDRVVHHAFCNTIEPLFDRTFIFDSYACRVGKGTHKAMSRCQEFIKKNKYVLQCDISKYFSSINHGVLLSILSRKIRDKKVMWLAELIINSALTVNGLTGIPIGNLTSQFFANLYLNELDYFVKFDLGDKCYLRYMDDFLIFSENKQHLHQAKEKINQFLESFLKLNLHPKKSSVLPINLGVDFCGFRIFKYLRKLRKSNIMFFKKRAVKMQRDFCRQKININKISQSIRAWVAHANWGNTYRLREKVMENLIFSRSYMSTEDRSNR